MLDRQHSPPNKWWMRGNFYSLYIDQFADTIQGLTAKLDYFTELGIDCLHLLPHYPSPMDDGGFDITDHTGVRPELGSLDDFKQLCDEAHKRGLKIMVDLVLNHTSDEHPWFIDARASQNSQYRDFYQWSITGKEYADAPIIFPDFKKSNWIYNDATDDYYYAFFKPSQPDLNWNNPAVVEAMLKIVDTLVSYGVDGFRLDAIMKLVEKEGTTSIGIPETHKQIKHLRRHVDKHHPHIVLLGEVHGTTEYSREYFGSGDECHLAYNFELMNEMLYALRAGGKPDRLKVAIEAARALPPESSWMSFLRNHDSVDLRTLDPKRGKQLLDLFDPQREFMFSKGADTVQRLASLLQNDTSLLREAFSLLYAIPSATVMYYGDEIGQPNSPLPPGEKDMRLVTRGPFDWEEAERQRQDPTSLFHHVRRCIGARISR